jgi:hypothetical protein
MPPASLPEPETDPERERLVNGIKRLCKEYALPMPEEDLYAVSHERLWELGRGLRERATAKEQAERAALPAPGEAREVGQEPAQSTQAATGEPSEVEQLVKEQTTKQKAS